nr:GAF domain-containing SpoIIE family protein phosphatase [Cellulomonas sp. RIT-PI-Y]
MVAEVAAERLTQILVPALADWCVVTLVDDDESRPGRRRLRDIAAWHREEQLRPVVQDYADARIAALTPQAFLSRAIADGQTVEVRHGARDALQAVLHPGPVHALVGQLAPESLAVLPLVRDERTIGALSLFRDAARSPLTPAELRTLREVTGAAALALDNARRFRRQRDVATTLQQALLTPPVEPDHVQIVVRYRPASEGARVGGDWYDAFVQPDGATILVIGDVAGHDLEAAAVMSQLRSMLRTIAVVTEAGPAGILEALDRAMRTLRISTMATVVVARVEQTRDEHQRGEARLRWSNAGHLPPLVVGSGGSVRTLTGRVPGTLLGLLPDKGREEYEVVLDRGSTVLLYTDGLIENRTRSLHDGLALLRAALDGARREDLDHLCDRLLTDLPAAAGEDDVALLAMRLRRDLQT